MLELKAGGGEGRGGRGRGRGPGGGGRGGRNGRIGRGDGGSTVGVAKKGSSSLNTADKRTTSAPRTTPCKIFCNGELKVLVPKQKGCDLCVKDILTMRRDAKQAGKEAVKLLQEAEKVGNEARLIDIHNEWIEVVSLC